MMRRQKLYGSYTDKSAEVLQTGAGLMRERVRNILLILLVLAVAGLAVVGGRAFAYRSETRSLFVATMQTECNEALSQCNSLSRTAGANSSATVGRIRANIHTMDTLNQLHARLEGGHYYVPVETFTELYTILDNYSSRLLTGLNTGAEQGKLQTALEELQALVSGL